jgi:hypothetical protein
LNSKLNQYLDHNGIFLMSSVVTDKVFGRGAAELTLSPEELRAIVAAALGDVSPGQRVLAIVPDKTRDDNTDLCSDCAGYSFAND